MGVRTIPDNATTLEFITAIASGATSCNAPELGGYNSTEDFVVKNGREFKVTTRTGMIPHGIVGQCFHNATELSLYGEDGLIYCEGYAHKAFIPVLHAWCINAKGEVFDPTWDEAGREYFGIAIKKEYLRQSLARRRHYGVIDNWEKHWPIFSAKPQSWRHAVMDTVFK